MRTGRPIARLSLAAAECESFESWARRPTTAQALAERARIVLECASGKPKMAVARKLRITESGLFLRNFAFLFGEHRPP